MSSTPAATVRLQGVVRWFKLPKTSDPGSGNYGFIQKSDGDSIFVHGSDVNPEQLPLVEGDIVEFTPVFSPVAGHTEQATAGDVKRIGRRPVALKSLPEMFTG